ncbi:conserved uncharacterized protein, paralogous family protein [Stigmatella aurantiaca DW4/3-1]|uniref:Conserved uncharacterized protein, paralogous family protein n=1 Tax=Stigmatella aurantiaca (strain DW4/3-1) TaxID=378806 RepID=Q095Y6_STIAD|nr:conserved uncharacterized protein, paralogous family protein [Stigmatella aurantiaca DW4/3-1]EAU67527.1 hypothetical protein STIAU_5907 [Stigmatella aurantiaca DW4/3-1]
MRESLPSGASSPLPISPRWCHLGGGGDPGESGGGAGGPGRRSPGEAQAAGGFSGPPATDDCGTAGGEWPASLCFELEEAARWDDPPGRWAQWEFELLRQAARAVDRPGQGLLLQSLERADRGLARRLRPHLNAQATHQWALCALHALAAKDAQPLRRERPALLQASDAHLLAHLPPPQAPRGSSRLPLCTDTAPAHPTPEDEDASARLSQEKGPNLSACPTGLSQRTPTGGSPPEALSADPRTPLGLPEAGLAQTPSSWPLAAEGLLAPTTCPVRGREPRGSGAHGPPVRPFLIPPLKPYFCEELLDRVPDKSQVRT